MAPREGKVKAVEEDFRFLQSREEVMAVVIFGSTAKEERTGRSDVDVCVVAPICRDREHLLREIYGKVDVIGKGYDVWIFEELPLYMKARIIKDHVCVYARDMPGLYEYFYSFRKLWEGQERRQRISGEEALRMLT